MYFSVYNSGEKISGVYKIDPDGLGKFEVYCDHKTAGGGWTVFQKRQDGSVDFFRTWDAYKRGFGNLSGEFWLGLEKIHRLTANSSNKLRVDLEDNHGNTAFAEYTSVTVASERAKYQLSLGKYSGVQTLAPQVIPFAHHRGQAFSTKDRDNDNYSGNCASSHKGAWWYRSCHYSNLNGLYLNGKTNASGMTWYYWKSSYYSVKRSEFSTKDRDNDKNSGNCALGHKGAWWYNACHDVNLNGLYLNGKTDASGMTWYHWKNSHYSTLSSGLR
ncbi:ryncolin-1-like [Montipora capricornis]|uniref:ryncolin-1-like n=1 Tax=Montipora capricornis TaxID=246305 RepID=UPI0035F1FBBE